MVREGQGEEGGIKNDQNTSIILRFGFLFPNVEAPIERTFLQKNY